MRKARAREAAPHKIGVDEILSEYDFSRARPNKHASRYAKDGVVITLDPDVAAVFPGQEKRTRLCARSRASSGDIGHVGRRLGEHDHALQQTEGASLNGEPQV